MTFSTLLESDLAVFFNTAEFGSVGIYYDKRGGEKNITVVISPLGDLSSYTTGQARIAEILIKKSDIAHPDIYDEVLIENKRWKIDQIIEEQQGLWKVLASRDQRSKTNA
jgi:hypothetical protein